MKNFERLDKFLDKLEKSVFAENLQIEKWDYLNEKNTSTSFEVFKVVSRLNFTGLKILDVGFGVGESLELFKTAGAIPTGINLSDSDLEAIKNKQYDVYKMDQSFLEFEDNSFDVVWSRHCLEHSIMPYYTLHEYYRVLKPGGYVYVEVPAPDTRLNHQENPGHYSVLPKSMWLSLMKRANFQIISQNSFNLSIITKEGGVDTYYRFILRKGEKKNG